VLTMGYLNTKLELKLQAQCADETDGEIDRRRRVTGPPMGRLYNIMESLPVFVRQFSFLSEVYMLVCLTAVKISIR